MKLTFLGGAGTVTGSKTLVEVGGTRLLVDCGLFQGLKHLRLRNWESLPLDVRALDAVLLTHAHIDHSGYLPKLVKAGFDGPIYCTAATADVVRRLLPDSGHLHEEDARYAARRGFSRHRPPKPLYTEADAVDTLRQLREVDWALELPVGELRATFRPAGHILGASMIEIAAAGRRVLFSGDLGRPHDALMPEPAVPQGRFDALVLESTYGLRTHPPGDPVELLHAVVARTVARGGTVVIPAFAVGRTQAILYGLHRLVSEGRLPAELRIFVNSPMAVDVTELYVRHADQHRLDEAATKAMCGAATLVQTVEESKALNQDRDPKVIISASGMITGGRVVHHLKAFAPDPKNTLLFCGFQAAGTRGAKILGGADTVRAHGDDVPIRCEVARIDGWSAHADHREIVAWLRKLTEPGRVYLNHGEPEAADALRAHIERALGWPVSLAELDEEITI